MDKGSETIESIVWEKDPYEEASRVHSKRNGSAEHYIYGNSKYNEDIVQLCMKVHE